MSLSSVFSVARSALNAQQVVIQTAGHNIANVETEGYSRQRAELLPLPEQHWTYGSVGTGVAVRDVTRARDTLLDGAYRAEASSSASSQLRHDLLSSVEGILGEPSDNGLAAAMDAFWTSWSDLASQPTSAAARSVVQQRGQNVAAMLNTFDARIGDLATQTQVNLENTVVRINTLSDQLAQLNGRIVSSEVDGTTAPDLRDQRDRALDELSKLANVRTVENLDGSMQVTIGNNTLVDGATGRHLQTFTTSAGQVALQLSTGGEPLLPIGGSTQTMMQFINGDLAEVRDRLDAVAAGLVSQVNALHSGGMLYPSTGTPTAAGAFFDAGGVTARDIHLDPTIAASAANVAAGAAVPTGVAGPGNNEVALALANLRTAPAQVTYVNRQGVSETNSFASFYRDTASRLGTQVNAAQADAEVHATLASQADARRQSVSGVNMDEELTTLMRAQQAYSAAAKVISTASEMMKTLIEMT